MSAAMLLDGLRARAPWRLVASPMLKNIGLYVGRGWEDTLEYLQQPNQINSDKESELKEALIQHLIAGEKSLRFYEADKSDIKKLIAHGLTKSVTENELTKVYPAVLSEGALRDIGNTQARFVHFYSTEAGHAFIYTSVRSYLKRTKLNPGALKEANDYEELIGIKKHRIHAYDVVWIPKEADYICVATDHPEDAPHNFMEAQQSLILNKICQIINKNLTPKNLWGAIDKLYSSTEGKVVQLGFVTDSDYVKRGNSRLGNCLREDRYHIAGAEVVGDSLTPFNLAVRWQREHDENDAKSQPEIILPGTSRMILLGNAELINAVFRNGLNIQDLTFVLSKLKAHM